MGVHPRKRSSRFDDPEYRRVRLTALAGAAVAVTWTAFCITTVFVRLDSANFGKWRDWLISADETVMPLSERFEAATAALRGVSRGVSTPVIAVADSIGAADSALPLSITVATAEDPSSAMARKEPAEAVPPVTAVASVADVGNQQVFGQLVGQTEVVLPKPRPIRHASLGGKGSKSKKQIATAHGYKENMPRRDLHPGADTRWASNELPPHSLFLEPDPRREQRRAILDGIFRGVFFNGGNSNECGPAMLKRGTQKKTGDDCQGGR